jgi:catechol 2,3-dioxygenase-like lactoylglutathione lyase family enzyme
VNFRRVAIATAAGRLDAQERFYRDRLGLPVERSPDRVVVSCGPATIEFAAAEGAPFTHFALLAPGNRFDEALAWTGERVQLLPDPDTGHPVFDFSFWDARACYFEDPAGNVVELIAHRGVEHSQGEGFGPGDLRGLSEVGLVTADKPAAAAALHTALGVEVWDGSATGPGLAFAGQRARTLILAPPGRRWLPTEWAAVACPTEVDLELERTGSVELDGGLIRIRS